MERPDNHCVLLYAKQERGDGHLAAQNTEIERISQTDALVQQASAAPANSEEDIDVWEEQVDENKIF